MTQRLDALDLLRGISIIGILFMNVYHHALFEIGYSPLAIPPLSLSMAALELYFVFCSVWG